MWRWFSPIAVLLVSCGPPPPVAVVTSPFTRQHAQVFDDAIDQVRDPSGLEGNWLQGWQQDLDHRAAWADLVALVTVRTLRTDVDLDQHQTYRVIVHVDRALIGNGEGEIELRVREGEPGYNSVREAERSLLDQQLMVFVKWAEEHDEEAGDTIRAHWHLCPATDVIAERVRDDLLRRDADTGGDRRRIIVRQQN